MNNKLQKFNAILNEGISHEELSDVLHNRLQFRYPDIIDKYGYDAVENAVNDVASFHAGAEELGSSDISIMLKEIIKALESSAVDEEVVTLPKWEIGLTVLVKHLGQKGKIASLGGDNAIVTVDNRQYRVPLSGLKRFPVKGVAENEVTEDWRNPSPEELKQIALGWAKKHPNIDQEIAAAEKAYDPYYEMSSGPTWSRGKQAADHLHYLKQVKAIIDRGLNQGVEEGLGTQYPGTYEQENNRFKTKGPRQTPKIAFEEEKIGGRYHPDEFDAMVRRLGQRAKEGPLKTVWDPVRRVYKNVPVNQEPAKPVKESSIMKGLKNVKR